MEPDVEKTFFNILSQLTGAFTQTGYIVAGTIMLLLGGVLLIDWLRWKVKAEEVEATITGLRQRGGSYFPVYRYMLDGVEQEATSNSGSSSTKGQDTGKQVTIQVMRHDPARAQPSRAFIWPLLGVLLSAPGLYLVYTAFTAFEVNGFTWATLAALGFMSLNRIRGAIIPKNQRLGREEWRLQKRNEIDLLPVQTAEDVRSAPDARAAEARYAKQAKVSGPLMLLMGAVAIAGGIYLGSETIDLMGAQNASGVVTQLAGDNSGSDGGYVYHAIVRFADAQGKEYTFRDKLGATHSVYEEGEKVNVLYKQENPQETAAIDRGFFNWLVPGALGIFGLLFMMAGIAQMPRQRDESY